MTDVEFRLPIIVVGMCVLGLDLWWLSCLYLLGAIPLLWWTREPFL